MENWGGEESQKIFERDIRKIAKKEGEERGKYGVHARFEEKSGATSQGGALEQREKLSDGIIASRADKRLKITFVENPSKPGQKAKGPTQWLTRKKKKASEKKKGPVIG